jgi:4'-phosphopantetheinyl transferase
VNDTLNLWWGSQDLAAQYRADLLHAADRARAEARRSPGAERDWRVSRALLQQARAAWPHDAGAPALSLSHARGHALVGSAPAGWRIGVDLEALRPRDFERLGRWCFSGEEQAALSRGNGQARRLRMFYLLWTLKEAFIKAANLDFPADMRSVGLAPDDGSARQGHSHRARPGAHADAGGLLADLPELSGWRLRAPPGRWCAYAAVVDDAWLASIVWHAPADDEMAARADGDVAPCWRPGRGLAAPRILPMAQWS